MKENKKTSLLAYAELLQEIKQRVRRAQYDALKAVNKELINLYWDIGKMIENKKKFWAKQSSKSWGKAIVENLARDLQKEFPGVQGFSAQNLWRMRQFYLTYENDEKLSPLVREIGWTHNIIILMNCKERQERQFYITMTRKFGWTKNVLIHQIENKSYEKTLINQTNFDKTLPAKIRDQAKLAVKDEYTFDFLELGEEHSERELERALIAKIERFLLEMGGLFTFVGSQYRLEINGKEYFIDILLYHRYLRCLVALELKIGEFQPEFIGKINFYLSALDDRIRLEKENPSIGIILCKGKDRTIVEYSLRDTHKPIGVSAYKTVTKLPAALKGQLPDPDKMKKLLEEKNNE